MMHKEKEEERFIIEGNPGQGNAYRMMINSKMIG